MSNLLSLIGTTQGGRNAELERLLDSLVGFKGKIELIFVDQSGDLEIKSLFEKYKESLDFVFLTSKKTSLSKARNIGLSYVKGNVVGFCDDDAFYNKDIISCLLSISISDNTFISFPVVDKSKNKFYANRKFPRSKGKMSFFDIARFSLSVGTFILLKDAVGKNPLRFNELLGAGAKYGGSEETELFFRLKSKGFRAIFDPCYVVYHDDDIVIDDLSVLAEKYEKYAVGYSLVLKEYILPSKFTTLIEIINIIFRSAFGVLISERRRLYIGRLKGLFIGLFERLR